MHEAFRINYIANERRMKLHHAVKRVTRSPSLTSVLNRRVCEKLARLRGGGGEEEATINHISGNIR
jgi:hypothetical protein